MSITKAYTLWCNACDTWVRAREDEALKSFRAAAKRMGWTRAKSGASHGRLIDKCPKCSKQERGNG